MMWSDRYNYYSIKSDLQHKKNAETGSVMKMLLQTGNFVQQDHQSLCNADHFPWTSITLAETKEGSFSSSKRQTDFINLIDIVCSKGKDIDQQLYLKTFLAIAEKLNWNLYLEADDEGNENVIVERMH